MHVIGNAYKRFVVYIGRSPWSHASLVASIIAISLQAYALQSSSILALGLGDREAQLWTISVIGPVALLSAISAVFLSIVGMIKERGTSRRLVLITSIASLLFSFLMV